MLYSFFEWFQASEFYVPSFRNTLFYLHRWCSCLHHLWRWNRHGVPKRRHIKFRSRGITQKEKIQHSERSESSKSRKELHVLKQMNCKWPYLLTEFIEEQKHRHRYTLVPFSFFIFCSFPMLSQYISLPFNHISLRLCPSYCFLFPLFVAIRTSLCQLHYIPHVLPFTLKKDAKCYSEILTPIYQITWQHVKKDR